MKPKNAMMFHESGSSSDDSFIWVSEISDDSLVSFYRDFSQKEQDPSVQVIPIIVSSYGGEVSSLLAMRDLIKSCPKPVATIALGKAMSAGACLLAAGTKGYRFASPDTLIMLHEVSGGSFGKTSDVNQSAAIMKHLNTTLLNNLAEDICKPVTLLEKRFQDLNNTDWTITSATAKKWGMVDHTFIPRIVQGMAPTMLLQTKKQSNGQQAKKPNLK